MSEELTVIVHYLPDDDTSHTATDGPPQKNRAQRRGEAREERLRKKRLLRECRRLGIDPADAM